MSHEIELSVAAKKNICSIKTDENQESIGDVLITKNESLESAVGSILSILEMAIKLHVSENNDNKNIVSMVNLIFAAKMNLENIYEKISY